MSRNDERHSKLQNNHVEQFTHLSGFDLEDIESGLELLHQASMLQDQFANSPEEKYKFAVEISELHQKGITNSDLYRLIQHGFLAHLIETTSSGKKSRKFISVENREFDNRSCFILTEEGIDLTQQLSTKEAFSPLSSQTETEIDNRTQKIRPNRIPVWDSERRELCFDGVVLKRFQKKASNQERILNAFEEKGWVRRIDDPLLHKNFLVRTAKLRSAVQKLNEKMKVDLIYFRVDKNREGICWNFVSK